MTVYRTQKEAESDIVNNLLYIEDDVRFECNIDIDVDIKAWNIDAKNIKVEDIKALNIKAKNIDSLNIEAKNIEAWNIKVMNINAENIKALNIEAENIYAVHIDYFAVCFAYGSIACKSWKAHRTHYKEPFALDGKVTLKSI